jgi:hypothetical protein
MEHIVLKDIYMRLMMDGLEQVSQVGDNKKGTGDRWNVNRFE